MYFCPGSECSIRICVNSTIILESFMGIYNTFSLNQKLWMDIQRNEHT